MEKVQDNYSSKMEALKLYIQNRMNRLAGEQPHSNILKKFSRSIKRTVLLGLLGLVVGSILGPFGAIVGAVFLAGFSSTSEEFPSDGSNYKEIRTGSGWLSYIILISLIVGLIYMYA